MALLAWRARGFVDKMVNNHLLHFKQDIVDAVQAGVEEENRGHDKIVDAVNDSRQQIVNALLLLKK